MFSLTLTGKIVDIRAPEVVGATQMSGYMGIEETHFVDGEVAKRFWWCRVSPEEWQRRAKLIVKERYIGVNVYDIDVKDDMQYPNGFALIALVSKVWIL